MATHSAEQASKTPLIWLVLGDKQGDNAQVEIVEQALPWTCIRKHVQVIDQYQVKKPRVKPSVDHIDLDASDLLKPPWPDVILTVGRRPSMVALWIKQQSAGLTRIVLFGKPSSNVKDYDMIISSSEILMPPVSNVLTIDYPLMRVDREAIQIVSDVWKPRLSDLPRPLIAIMVGGPTKPYVYDQRTVENITRKAQEIISQQAGTPYIVTSRRTPDDIVDMLIEKLPENCRLYRWGSRADENPYKALLGVADGFMVTEDSISMIIEIVKLGKPLAIINLATGRFGWLDSHRRRLTGKLFSNQSETMFDTLRIMFANVLYKLKLVRQVRDYRAFQDKLIAQGYAVQIDQPLNAPSNPLVDNLSKVSLALIEFVNAA